MIKTAEAVSLGHPDKIADYISSYLLDRMIEQDPSVKYAVEVMIKNNTVVLGGEITGNVCLKHLKKFVLNALADIGYTKEYARKWKEYSIEPDKIKIINLIGHQSGEIYQGVQNDGWGDQGVFVGYACQGKGHIGQAQWLAKHLNQALYEKALQSDTLGLDIKTQITLDEHHHVQTAVVAIPMLKKTDLSKFVTETLGEKPKNLIINGTGIYQSHASIADCGITGRKLACDFYETEAPIGGGSPWTKDSTKADLSLNLYARKLALMYLKENDSCFIYLSSCIGHSDLLSAVVKTIKNGVVSSRSITITLKPSEIITLLGLNRPIFAHLCKKGLFSLTD